MTTSDDVIQVFTKQKNSLLISKNNIYVVRQNSYLIADLQKTQHDANPINSYEKNLECKKRILCTNATKNYPFLKSENEILRTIFNFA